MARPYFLQGAGSTNKTLVQKNLTKVKGWYCSSIDSVPVYLLLYDAAAATDVTVGTGSPTTPKWKIMIPANNTAANGAGANAAGFDLRFDLGLVIAVVKGIGTDSNTAVDADEVIINLEIE